MFIFWMIGGFLILSALFFVRAAMGYSRVTKDGRTDYAYRKSQDLLQDQTVSESEYLSHYKKTHGPRGALYSAAALLAAGLVTWPLLGTLVQIFEYGWRLSGQPRAFEPGYLVWQFMLFAGMIVGYAVIAWVTARLYHRQTADRVVNARSGAV